MSKGLKNTTASCEAAVGRCRPGLWANPPGAENLRQLRSVLFEMGAKKWGQRRLLKKKNCGV